MYPVLFRIGSLEITSFGASVAIGALVGLWLFQRELRRGGEGVESHLALLLPVAVAVVAMLLKNRAHLFLKKRSRVCWGGGERGSQRKGAGGEPEAGGQGTIAEWDHAEKNGGQSMPARASAATVHLRKPCRAVAKPACVRRPGNRAFRFRFQSRQRQITSLVMKVFMSWSGERSRALANALGPWLRQVVQSVEPWMSNRIGKGMRSGTEIAGALDNARAGIICVTAENLESAWINFEAGALSKTPDIRVCTVLLD